MRFLNRTLLISTSLSIITGCSIFSGDEETVSVDDLDYTQAEMTTALSVPANVGQDNSQDLFVVPDLLPESTGVVYGPDVNVLAPMQILSLGNDVRANRDTRSASAFINADELKVWDIINRFMQSDNIAMSSRDIVTEGVTVSTDWVVTYREMFWGDDEPDTRHRYKIKVLEAERPNETRLDVEVMVAEKFTDDEGWEPNLEDNRAGAEFLNQILGFMYVENIRQSRERVSQSGLGGITVSLGSDPDGNPALVTSADFEQTWSRVPIAMQMVKMRVDDRDRSQGLYFVSRNNDEESFFDSLAFWSDDDDESIDLERGAYRVQVISEGARTYIVFTDTDDVPLKADILAQNFALLSKAFKARVTNRNNS